MELHDLKIFHYAAAEQSFSKAAQTLFISQPAVSASIKKLEFDMGCKLFERVGKNIRLTSAGQILYGYTTKIFEILKDIHADIEKQRGEIKGSITVAAEDTAGCFLMPQILGSFAAKYENVELQLNISPYFAAKRLVEEGRAEFAVVCCELPEKPGQLHVEKLADDRVVLIGPSGMPGGEGLADYAGFDKLCFIMHEKGTALFAAAERIIGELSLKAEKRLYINSVTAMVQAVKTNAGIAAVPVSAVWHELKLGEVKRLYPSTVGLEMPYYILYSKTRCLSLAEETLAEFIKSRMAALLVF